MLGVESLGVWSLVVALASLAKLGELGLSGSVVKFVARAEATGGRAGEAARIIRLSAVLVAVSLAVAAAIAYPLLSSALEHLLTGPALAAAREILPLSLVVVWVNGVASVLLGALEGYQRADLRAATAAAGALALLFGALILVPGHGLHGVVVAQLIQALVLCVLPSWYLRGRASPPQVAIPRASRRTLLKELLGYGGAFQLITIVGLLLDPMTKAILASVGTPGTVAYFEMASKMVAQFRALIVSANQVVVPWIASLKEAQPARIAELYRASFRMLAFLAIPLLATVGAATPLIAEFWIGHYQQDFVVLSLMLIAANFLNILSGPAYFSNLGEGELRWNVRCHLLMALLNGILGIGLGTWFGIYGAVAGNALAVAISSVLLMLAYHARRSIRVGDLLGSEDTLLLAAGLGVIGLSLLLHDWLTGRVPLAANALYCAVAVGAILILPVWRHTARRRLGDFVAGAFRRTVQP
jgi:O-antigen/teichoic acid export membrane protein